MKGFNKIKLKKNFIMSPKVFVFDYKDNEELLKNYEQLFNTFTTSSSQWIVSIIKAVETNICYQDTGDEKRWCQCLYSE